MQSITQEFGEIKFGLIDTNGTYHWFQLGDKLQNQNLSELVFKELFHRKKKLFSFILKAAKNFNNLSPNLFFVSDHKEPDEEFKLTLSQKLDEDSWRPEDSEADDFAKKISVSGFSNIFIFQDSNTPLYNLDGQPFCFYIKLDRYGHFKQLSDYLRKNISHLEADITSYLTTNTNIDRKEYEGYDSEELNLYNKVNNILDELYSITHEITTQPHYTLNPELIQHNINHFNQSINPLLIYTDSTSKYYKHLKKFETYLFVNITKNYNTSENTFVKNGIKSIMLKIEFLFNEISKSIQQKQSIRIENSFLKREIDNFIDRHTKVLEKLILYKDRFLHLLLKLNSYGQNLNFENNMKGYSEIINYDKRYARFNQLILFLNNHLFFRNTSEEKFSSSVQPFNKFYKQWCFYLVFDSLKKIGFYCTNEDEQISFYHVPIENYAYNFSHPNYPFLSIRLYNERDYKSLMLSNESYGLANIKQAPSYYIRRKYDKNWRAKYTPDIALEIFDSNSKDLCPIIITLDPTLSNNFREFQSKYEYLDSIRCFYQEDINGESRRVVSSSWAIIVGSRNEYRNEPFFQHDGSDFSKGFIKLNHIEKSQDSLVELLKILLNKTNKFNL